MSDTQEVIREFRFLDDKRKSSGLTSDEEYRWQALAQSLGIPLPAPAPQGYWGTDGQWYAYPPEYDPQLAYQQGYTPEGYPTGYYDQAAGYGYPQPGYEPQTGQPYADPPAVQGEGQWQQQGQWPAEGYEPAYAQGSGYEAPQTANWPEPNTEQPAPAQDSSGEDGPIEVDADDVMEVSDDDVELLDPSPPVSAPAQVEEAPPAPLYPEPSLTGSLDDVGVKPEKRLTHEVVAASSLLPVPEAPQPAPSAPEPASFLPEPSAPLVEAKPAVELLADVLPAEPAPQAELEPAPISAQVAIVEPAVAVTSTPAADPEATLEIPPPSESVPVPLGPIAERAPILLFAAAPAPLAAKTAEEAVPFHHERVTSTPIPCETIAEPQPVAPTHAAEPEDEATGEIETASIAAPAPSAPLLPELAPAEEAPTVPAPEPAAVDSSEPAAPAADPTFPAHHTPSHLLPRREPLHSSEDPISFLRRALAGDSVVAAPVSTDAAEPVAPVAPLETAPQPVGDTPTAAVESTPLHDDMPLVEAITVVEAPVPQSASLLAAALLGDEADPTAPAPSPFTQTKTPTAFPSTRTPAAFPSARTPVFGAPPPAATSANVPTPPRGTAIPKEALPSLSIKAGTQPLRQPVAPAAPISSPSEWDDPAPPAGAVTEEPALELVEATVEVEPAPLEGEVVEEAPLDLVETAPSAPEWRIEPSTPDPAPTARFGRPATDWSADVLTELPFPAPPQPQEAYNLSGAADDKVELAKSAAEFLSYPATPAADVSSAFSEEGNDLIDVSPLAAMANPTEYGYDRSDSLDDGEGELELATNADFVTNPGLTNTGEKWSSKAPPPAAKNKWQTGVDDLLPPEKPAPRPSPTASKSVRDFNKPAAMAPLPVKPPAAPPKSSPPLPAPRQAPASFKAPPPPDEEVLQGMVVEEDDAPGEFEIEEHEALPSVPPPPPPRSAPTAPARAAMPVAARPVQPAVPHLPGAPVVPRPSVPGGPRGADDRRGIGFHEDTGLKLIVPGDHKVILHTLEGQVKRGLLRNPDMAGKVLTLESGTSAPAELIARPRLKVVFFVQPPDAKPEPITGTKVRVTLRDGRQVAGFSTDYKNNAPGFFVVPAENRTKTARIFIYRDAITAVTPD
ncbi:MAG: hypothetical protein K1X64_13060 [Myxococcaceae bacterium]|nr:hypothetical protein [Myxococcaceae bacterium]